MKSTVLFALLAIAGTVSSGNVTSTTTKPSTGAKKSTSTTKVTVPTVRPPVFPTPALFPPHVQNWPSRPLPQQFTQPAFQPQTQFPLQSFAPQQSAFPQAPQPNFFPQPSFQSSFGQQPFQQQFPPLAFGQQPAFQQQQFPQPGQQPAFQQQFSQPSFSQQPRVISQSASPQNVATNTNAFATHPQSNFFTPVSHQLTQPSTPQLTSKAAAIPQKHPSAIQPSQSQPSQSQSAPAVQSQFSFPIPQSFQQNPQQFQQQSLIPNSNVQPFSGFQQWQPMANPIGASLQPSFGLLPKPLHPPNAGAQAFEQFQPSDSQVFNSFIPQQSPFTSFARPELAPWNPSQSNSFFTQLQQPQLQQLQQPQFSPFMGFPQSNSMFA